MRIHLTIAVVLGLTILGLGSTSVEGHANHVGNVAEYHGSQSQDDIWAVIEIPQGQELSLEMAPAATMPSAKGSVRVVRNSTGTEINVEASGLTTEVESYHVFAIDSLGSASALGTLSVVDGAGSLRAQSALTQFMIVVSPKEDLVTLTPETPIVLRSKAPEGYKTIPRVSAPELRSEPATSAEESESPLMSDYDVPLLGIETLKRGGATQMKARLFEEFQGSRVNASITPGKKGTTQVDLVFRDLKPAADGRHYVVWAVSSDKSYSVLGKALPGKQSKINTVAEFSDFGIMITAEDSESPLLPTGKMVAMVIR